MSERNGPTGPSKITPTRQNYYRRLGERSMAPLWETLHTLVTAAPASPAIAHKWDYEHEIRDLLLESGGLITTEEAERRVLILENPGMPGMASITHTLYAGIQMILPGETARAHRHSQSALRFIIEGFGAYTAVNGERVVMKPGDLVITPNWAFHDHGNDTADPMVWIDGLDVPMVKFLDASFFEHDTAMRQSQKAPTGDSAARFGSNLVPVDWKSTAKASPLFSYPYERTREVLATLARNEKPNPCHGHKMRYVNPVSGDHVMATIGTFIQLLPEGMETSHYRCTDGTVYSVVEGTGRSTIGEKSFSWKPKDVFVAPSWSWQRHRADSDAVLFSYSDRPAQEKLDLWREERST